MRIRIARLLLTATIAGAILAAFPNLSGAAIPQKVNFQGRLTDASGNAISGTRTVVFSIWDAATSGTQLWSESQSVAIATGIYNVTLGSTTDISTNVFTGQNAWLQVQVGADPAMTPRVRVSAVPYAFVAQQAIGLTSFLPTDDLFTLQPLNANVSLSSPYTVPAGKNFVGSIYARGGCDYDTVTYGTPPSTWSYTTNLQTCLAPVSGNHSATTAAPRHLRNSALILGEGDVLSSTSSSVAHQIRGVLVPNRVTVVLQDIAASGTYTVPGGKSLYFQSFKTAKNCTGNISLNGFTPNEQGATGGLLASGETLTNGTNCVATLMGYLK